MSGTSIIAKISMPLRDTCTYYNLGINAQQNLSSGFPTKWDTNQSAQLQILARKIEILLVASLDITKA